MTDFSDLTAATARTASDEFAVTDGSTTERMTLALLLADLLSASPEFDAATSVLTFPRHGGAAITIDLSSLAAGGDQAFHSAATATARAALTGLAAGDVVYQADNDSFWEVTAVSPNVTFARIAVGSGDATETILAAFAGKGAGKHLAVNSADDGYEWVDPPTPGTGGAARSRQDTVDLLTGDTGGDIDFTRDGSGASSDLRGSLRDDTVGTAELSASGTPGDTVYLRGDNEWAAPPGVGDVALSLAAASEFVFRSAPRQFAATTVNLSALPDWGYLHVVGPDGTGDYILFRKSDLLATTAATVGAAQDDTTNNGIAFPDALGAGSDFYLGHTTAGLVLVATNGGGLAGHRETIQFFRGTPAAPSDLSDDPPLGPGTAAAGTGAEASRDDHVHPRQTGIATAEILDLAVSSAKLADDAVTNAKVADDAVGTAELSATGAPSASTFLRGDNSWAAPPGGGTATPLSDTAPAADGAASAGVSTAASRSDHVHPVTSDEVLANAVTHLQQVTSDLEAGTTPTGWADASADAQGGVALASTAFTQTSARAVTQWARSVSPGDSSFWVVRVPATADPAQARLVLRSATFGTDFPYLVSQMSRLGASADGNWVYYHDGRDIDGDLDTLRLQVTGSAAHVGTSTYAGNLDRGKVYAQVKDILVGGTDDDSAETVTLPDGPQLPALNTGTAGQVPKINSGATAVEWADDETGGGSAQAGTQPAVYAASGSARQAIIRVSATRDGARGAGETEMLAVTIPANSLQSAMSRFYIAISFGLGFIEQLQYALDYKWQWRQGSGAYTDIGAWNNNFFYRVQNADPQDNQAYTFETTLTPPSALDTAAATTFRIVMRRRGGANWTGSGNAAGVSMEARTLHVIEFPPAQGPKGDKGDPGTGGRQVLWLRPNSTFDTTSNGIAPNTVFSSATVIQTALQNISQNTGTKTYQGDRPTLAAGDIVWAYHLSGQNIGIRMYVYDGAAFALLHTRTTSAASAFNTITDGRRSELAFAEAWAGVTPWLAANPVQRYDLTWWNGRMYLWFGETTSTGTPQPGTAGATNWLLVGPSTLQDVVPGEVDLWYFEEREIQYQVTVSGEYRVALLTLPSHSVTEGEHVLVWLDINDPGATVALVDNADLANAGTLAGGVPVVDGFASLEVTRTSGDDDTVVVRLTGDHTGSLRYRLHGAWRANGANDLGIGAMKAAVQTAIEPESFPPAYDSSRGWAPGEHFYLENAVYRVDEHSIAVSDGDVPESSHFTKIVDGAASRSDDIDARVADWAEQGYEGSPLRIGGTDGAPHISIADTGDVSFPLATVDHEGTGYPGMILATDIVRLRHLWQGGAHGQWAAGTTCQPKDVVWDYNNQSGITVVAECRRLHVTSLTNRPASHLTGSADWAVVAVVRQSQHSRSTTELQAFIDARINNWPAQAASPITKTRINVVAAKRTNDRWHDTGIPATSWVAEDTLVAVGFPFSVTGTPLNWTPWLGTPSFVVPAAALTGTTTELPGDAGTITQYEGIDGNIPTSGTNGQWPTNEGDIKYLALWEHQGVTSLRASAVHEEVALFGVSAAGNLCLGIPEWPTAGPLSSRGPAPYVNVYTQRVA